jgi:hypothetical protein
MKVIDMGALNPWTSIINLVRHPRPRCDGRHIKVYLELELDWLVRRHRGAFRSMHTSWPNNFPFPSAAPVGGDQFGTTQIFVRGRTKV